MYPSCCNKISTTFVLISRINVNMPQSNGKQRKQKGGSTASDAVTKLVSPSTFELMNKQFTNDFKSTIGGASCRRKAPCRAANVDMNRFPATSIMVHNAHKGGAVADASIGRMDAAPYPIPNSVASDKGSMPFKLDMLNMDVVPYPQQELAERSLPNQTVVGATSSQPTAVGGAGKKGAKQAGAAKKNSSSKGKALTTGSKTTTATSKRANNAKPSKKGTK